MLTVIDWFVNGFVYFKNNLILTEKVYDYYLKGHFENTRVRFTESTTIPGQAEALQVDNYYPFGMRFNQAPILQVEENNYLYNGKELQKNYGLDWYDYGARMYDAALGRWHCHDPLEQFHSPYNYAGNNPINLIDPSGMYAVYVNGKRVRGKKKRKLLKEYGLPTASSSSSSNNEGDSDDISTELGQLKDIAQKGKQYYDGFKGIYNAIEGFDTGNPQGQAEAMSNLYSSLGVFLPNISYSVFLSQYKTILPMIIAQLDVIQQGLQQRDKLMNSYWQAGTGQDLGVMYPGAYAGGRQMYNYMVSVKNDRTRGKITGIPSNVALQMMYDNASLYQFVSGRRVPFSLTRLSKFQLMLVKHTGVGKGIKNDVAIYYYQNFRSIEKAIYGGLKIKE